MKIGIMGGTFDPIHIGHLLLGEFAYEDFGLDEIWFLPTGNPPHKETLDTGAALKHRIEMIKSNSGCLSFPPQSARSKRFRAFLHLSDHAGIQSDVS